MGQQQGTPMATPDSSRKVSAALSVQFPQPVTARELSAASVATLDDPLDSVPVMFKWTHGGQRVFLTGTFNHWAKEGIPMVRSGQEFYQIIQVPKGVHEYKFLVDGEWKFSLDQPVLQDTSGNVNNVVDIQYYEEYAPAALQDPLEVSPDDEFSTNSIDPAVIGGGQPSPEPPGVPPLLMRLPFMGLACGGVGFRMIEAGQLAPAVDDDGSPSVNIPLFAVVGHVAHDACVSFKGVGSDTILASSSVRFAQKFSTLVLATLNNSPRADGLVKHYGLGSEQVATPAEGANPHLFLSALQGVRSPLHPPSLSLDGLLKANPKGILRRGQSSGTSRIIDISTFSD